MRRLLFLLLLAATLEARPIAFTNVNLISMTGDTARDAVLPKAVVIVDGGRIVAVGREGEVTVPADATLEATSAAGAALTYTASAVDSTGEPVPVTCTPASGSIFPLGTTTVTCTATDAHGNVTTQTFQVTVQDTTPPMIVLNAFVRSAGLVAMKNCARPVATSSPAPALAISCG